MAKYFVKSGHAATVSEPITFILTFSFIDKIQFSVCAIISKADLEVLKTVNDYFTRPLWNDSLNARSFKEARLDVTAKYIIKRVGNVPNNNNKLKKATTDLLTADRAPNCRSVLASSLKSTSIWERERRERKREKERKRERESRGNKK